MKDQRLEELSDLVRNGVPIDFADALEVITYQEKLREHRNITRRSTLTGKAGDFFAKLKFLAGFSGK